MKILFVSLLFSSIAFAAQPVIKPIPADMDVTISYPIVQPDKVIRISTKKLSNESISTAVKKDETCLYVAADGQVLYSNIEEDKKWKLVYCVTQ